MNSPYPELEKLRREMLTCTQCGFCKNVCPVFLDVGWDSGAPRGRMTLAYGLLSGELQPDAELINRIFQCTQCTDCYRRCPSSAKTPEVVLAARREMVQRGHAGDAQKMLVQNVQKTGNIYADEDVEFPVEQGSLSMFVGCQHLSRPNSTKKAIKLLKALNITVRTTEEICCGFPLAVMGFEQEHRQQIEKVKAMLPEGDGPVLTLCPSCQVHLEKEYHRSSIHILQLLDDKLREKELNSMDMRVTYHDPCDLSRGAGITGEPRRILKKLGCEIVEMEHHHDQSRCCGGGGGILTWDDALSGRLAEARIEEALATGTDMLVTACPTCEQILKQGAKSMAERNGGKPLKVRHILDLVAKALK